jgi:alpha-glucosidase (family GH31 glycosyl hydrolase)
MRGRWIKGGRSMRVSVADDATPLFIRDGSAVPMQRGMPVDGNVDLSRIEMHLFMSPTFRGTLTGRYCFDDGETLAYQEGQESDLSFSVRVSKGVMNIRIEQDMRDRPCRLSWVLYRKIKSIRLQVDGDVNPGLSHGGSSGWLAGGQGDGNENNVNGIRYGVISYDGYNLW